MKSQNKRIQQWIEKLEKQATDLLDGIELDELTAKERVELALKCLGHTQRFIMLDQQLESETPTGQTTVMLAAIMRSMRGELLEAPTVDGDQKEPS